MQELNLIIANKNLKSNLDLIKHLFPEDQDVFIIPSNEDWDMYDCLVKLKAFPSKSEARKNWTRTGKEILPGYNEFKNIGKQKKALYIWNPVGDEE
jgi:hypothetical protein